MAGSKDEDMKRAISKKSLDRVEKVFFWWQGAGGFDPYKLLKEALKKRQTHIAMFFLNRVTDVNGDDLPCDTPLYIACKNGDVEIVRALLRRGATDQNSKSKKKKKQKKKKIYCSTPLHIATKKGYDHIVKMLLDFGADANTLDENGNTAVDLAAKDDHIIKLLSQTSNTSCKRAREKSFSCSLNYEEISELIGSGVDINTVDGKGRTVLMRAVASEDISAVQLLLEHNCDVNITDHKGISPLHLACKKVSLVELLLDKGARVNGTTDTGETPLHWVVRGGCVTDVNLLLKSGADLELENVYGETAFVIAARQSSIEIVECLLEQGAGFDIKTRDGLSPLLEAVEKGQDATVAAILRYGPSLESKNSALLAAVGSHRESIVELLVQNGADIECKCSGGTMLHWATKGERVKTMELLLRFGADIDSKSDKRGFTALHIACERGLIRPLNVLLEHGANVNSFSKDGFIPICVIPATNILSEAKTILKDHIIKDAIVKTFPEVKLETVSFAGQYKWILDNTEPFEDELLLMMVGTIGNSHISFYELLVKDVSHLRKLVKNKDIVQAVSRCDVKKKFPIYHSLLVGQVRKAQRFNCLIDRAARLLNIICSKSISSQLPEICTDEIFLHLSVKDVRNFIAAEL